MTPPWRTYPSPHIRRYHGVTVIDYNGTGRWSADAIRARYLELAQMLNQQAVSPLKPKTATDGIRTWIYPLMDEVIALIGTHDASAVELGLDMLEEDEFFAFGKLLKYNTARALRRTVLSDQQKERVRRRVVAMLLTGNVPYEIREYKRLLRAVGVGDYWPLLDAGVDRSNRFVMRHYGYLDRLARSLA